MGFNDVVTHTSDMNDLLFVAMIKIQNIIFGMDYAYLRLSSIRRAFYGFPNKNV
jgi:hypothetical protein